ncbi:endonuclease/exonuclease/phosphatase family protein [Rhodocaloribacter litoris]|uniref:endonuclease/exonuclease/phosphatase family protein n=1 Tax=Rhodocaloribacter litoris TaxID=2558931 RepID=UPI001424998A|nr:endonuclease/exonuclease/phosphatase family protein [Rhodocaloribacter litoris]QXD16151.1 endonuclease/exonuclease/phosphatase family protein [Rhodocaloribacter litoris]
MSGVRRVRAGMLVVPALLFLGGYAAAYVAPGPGVWVLQLLGPLVPPLSLVVVGVAVWVLLRRAPLALRGLYAGMLVLVALRFGGDVPRLWRPVAVPPGAAGDTLVVLSLNARGPERTVSRAFRDVLAVYRPHVVGLQEAAIAFYGNGEQGFSGEVFPVLQAGYGLPDRSGEGVQGVGHPVFVRGLAGTFEVIPVGPAGEGGHAVRAELSWCGCTFVVYNVHLRSYLSKVPLEEGRTGLGRLGRALRTLRDDVLVRAGEARALRRRIEAETRPVLVVGDFNATRHEWAFRELARGFTDAVRARGPLYAATFPARRPLVRIDHILAGPGWQVLAAGIGPAMEADHRPVLAALRLDAPANDSTRTCP